ncbi:MAG: hypothetical protein J6C33_04315 [Lachnospiraceae bacterium]|nr:hypothetical protein [Lachnospiraceae bacterium]
MNDTLFQVITAFIPVIGAAITGFIIPYIKAKISSARLEEISQWVAKAVKAADVLFDVPKSGEKKREYVISFIDKTFNAKKEVITKDQIRILLEVAWKEMTET